MFPEHAQMLAKAHHLRSSGSSVLFHLHTAAKRSKDEIQGPAYRLYNNKTSFKRYVSVKYLSFGREKYVSTSRY